MFPDNPFISGWSEYGFHPSGAKVEIKNSRGRYYFPVDVFGRRLFEFGFSFYKDGKWLEPEIREYNFVITPDCEINAGFMRKDSPIPGFDQHIKNYLIGLMLSFARDFHKSTVATEEMWAAGFRKMQRSFDETNLSRLRTH